MSVAGPLAYAQAPQGAGGPVLVRPDVRRLPPIEPLPLPAEAVPVPVEDVVTEPAPAPAVKLWEGGLELGLDGSEGNTETFGFRFGFDAKRTTTHNVLTLDLDYRKKTNRYIETTNRACLDWRFERLLQDPRWTAFVHGTVDYDEFQSFDVRATLDIGMGHQLIKSESTSLAARVGSGFSREIGGPDESYVPEASFGLNFEHRLNQRQKLTASADYTPDVTDFNSFRLKTRAAWEVLIDQETNLSLKLSVLDRYDSTPHGAKPNDLDYAATLLWKF